MRTTINLQSLRTQPFGVAKPRAVCRPMQPLRVASLSQQPEVASTDRVAARRELDAAREQRAAERLAEQDGIPWWEVDCPDNMVNVADLQQLQQLVEDANAAGRLAVVQFFATDCYACRSMQPKMRQIARDNGDVLFIKLNGAGSEELGKYCEDMQIDRIPYFHFYQQNKRVTHFSANMRPEKLQQLRQAINKHRTPELALAETA